MENDTQKKEITMDELASMVQNGFLNIDGRFDLLEAEIKEVKTDIKEIKGDIEDIKIDLNKKVDIFSHNDLTYRVEKLEDKKGLAKPAMGLV